MKYYVFVLMVATGLRATTFGSQSDVSDRVAQYADHIRSVQDILMRVFELPIQEKTAAFAHKAVSSSVKNPILKALHLAVQTEKERYNRGEPIVLKVSVKNDTASVVYLPNTYHPEWDYKFEVTNEEKKSVPLTADGELLTKNIAIFRRVGDRNQTWR